MVQSSLRLWAAYTLTDIILSHLVYWHKSKFIVIIKSVHQQQQRAPPRCLSELFIRKNFLKNVYYPHFISMGGTKAVVAMRYISGTQGREQDTGKKKAKTMVNPPKLWIWRRSSAARVYYLLLSSFWCRPRSKPHNLNLCNVQIISFVVVQNNGATLSQMQMSPAQ